MLGKTDLTSHRLRTAVQFLHVQNLNLQAEIMPAVPSKFDIGICGWLTYGGPTAKLIPCKEVLIENLLCHWPRPWAPELVK